MKRPTKYYSVLAVMLSLVAAAPADALPISETIVINGCAPGSTPIPAGDDYRCVPVDNDPNDPLPGGPEDRSTSSPGDRYDDGGRSLGSRARDEFHRAMCQACTTEGNDCKRQAKRGRDACTEGGRQSAQGFCIAGSTELAVTPWGCSIRDHIVGTCEPVTHEEAPWNVPASWSNNLCQNNRCSGDGVDLCIDSWRTPHPYGIERAATPVTYEARFHDTRFLTSVNWTGRSGYVTPCSFVQSELVQRCSAAQAQCREDWNCR